MCEKCEQNHQELDPLVEFLSRILPTAPDRVVQDLVNMATLELFVRSEPETFHNSLDDFTALMHEVLDEDNRDPMLAEVFKARDERLTEADMSTELDEILDEHGILDDTETYGNYP